MNVPSNSPIRLLRQITRISMQGNRGDVRIFCEERLVYASYDGGRTQVVNTGCREGHGLLRVLKGVFNQAHPPRAD